MSRRLDRLNIDDFSTSLLHTDWSPVFSCACVTDQWTAFLQLFLPILDSYAPLKRIKIYNPSAPPVSDTTLRLMARRRGLLAREGRTPAFRALDRQVKSAIRRDVRDDIASRVRRQGPASIFRNVRQVIEGRRPTRVAPEATPTELNEYFVWVGPRVAAEVRDRGGDPSASVQTSQGGRLCFLSEFYLTPVSQVSPLFYEKLFCYWL